MAWGTAEAARRRRKLTIALAVTPSSAIPQAMNERAYCIAPVADYLGAFANLSPIPVHRSCPMIERFAENPLLSPADVQPSRPDFEVLCVFNAGATRFNGKTLLLLRVAERPIPEPGYLSTAVCDPESPDTYKVIRVREDDPQLDATDPRVFAWRETLYLTSISHLRVATSEDGRHFDVAPAPAMRPETAYETYGVEDPRITRLGEWYYVNYSAISLRGVVTCLARTRDFVDFERLGVMFAPDNKDIAIFPEQIDGRWCCFHRPSMKQLGAPSVWLAYSDDLLDWGAHEFLLGPRPGHWDSERVGCGAPPIKTSRGWLQFYHGSDFDTRYCTGAVLLDPGNPRRILARSNDPLLAPEAPYETTGFMPNVVFHNGLVENADGTVDLYYGAADWLVAGARIDVDAVLGWLGN